MKKDIILIATKESELLTYLIDNIDSKSKNNVKSLLKWGNVFVNGNKVYKHNFMLSVGDEIKVVLNKTKIDNTKSNINIVYEDENIIAINKPSGLISSTETLGVNSAFNLVQSHLKNINKNNKLYLVHRLDKDTSGVLLFAKNIETKKSYQSKWDEIALKRGYKAIVVNNLNKSEGTIDNYLAEVNQKVFVTKSSKEGKQAITKYKVLKEKDDIALLDLEILTGRKNQIRVQLANVNSPILGDKKYGNSNNKAKRLMLHADSLILKDPYKKKKISIKCDIPMEFNKVI